MTDLHGRRQNGDDREHVLKVGGAEQCARSPTNRNTRHTDVIGSSTNEEESSFFAENEKIVLTFSPTNNSYSK